MSGGDERGLMVVTHYFFSTVNYGELIMTDTTNTATPKVAKLNEQSQIAFKKWSSDTVNADLNKKQRLETLRQQGWKSTMFISPKSAGSTATKASWDFAKTAINSGFPVAAQKLMAQTPKVAGDKTVRGQSRAYWKKQANAILADMKTQMQIAEEIDADVKSGKQGADATTRSAESLCVKDGEAIVNRIKKADSFIVVGKDLPDWIAEFEALIKMIQK